MSLKINIFEKQYRKIERILCKELGHQDLTYTVGS